MGHGRLEGKEFGAEGMLKPKNLDPAPDLWVPQHQTHTNTNVTT